MQCVLKWRWGFSFEGLTEVTVCRGFRWACSFCLAAAIGWGGLLHSVQRAVAQADVWGGPALIFPFQVMIVVGGQAPKAIRSVECYDFEEERWDQVAELPSRRCRAGNGKACCCFHCVQLFRARWMCPQSLLQLSSVLSSSSSFLFAVPFPLSLYVCPLCSGGCPALCRACFLPVCPS